MPACAVRPFMCALPIAICATLFPVQESYRVHCVVGCGTLRHLAQPRALESALTAACRARVRAWLWHAVHLWHAHILVCR